MFKNIFKKSAKEATDYDISDEEKSKVYYDIDEYGDVSIWIDEFSSLLNNIDRFIRVKNDKILILESDKIVCLEEVERYDVANFISTLMNHYGRKEYASECMEQKKDYCSWVELCKVTYELLPYTKRWHLLSKQSIGKKDYTTLKLQDIFINELHSKYKLLENEKELDNYISSTLSCDDWCRLKLINKMKELGLGDGFINAFADLIGNDLNKYHQMIDLANECNDIDTLMYMYTYKFGGINEKRDT